LVGGAGDDILTGSYGIDVFDYGFKNAGNDTSLKHQVTISNQIKHSNVAITVADNAFTDVADNTNTTIITNTANPC
jgi:hypothetical protein